MPEDKLEPGPANVERINVHEPDNVRDWAARLQVNEDPTQRDHQESRHVSQRDQKGARRSAPPKTLISSRPCSLPAWPSCPKVPSGNTKSNGTATIMHCCTILFSERNSEQSERPRASPECRGTKHITSLIWRVSLTCRSFVGKMAPPLLLRPR